MSLNEPRVLEDLLLRYSRVLTRALWTSRGLWRECFCTLRGLSRGDWTSDGLLRECFWTVRVRVLERGAVVHVAPSTHTTSEEISDQNMAFTYSMYVRTVARPKGIELFAARHRVVRRWLLIFSPFPCFSWLMVYWVCCWCRLGSWCSDCSWSY